MDKIALEENRKKTKKFKTIKLKKWYFLAYI